MIRRHGNESQDQTVNAWIPTPQAYNDITTGIQESGKQHKGEYKNCKPLYSGSAIYCIASY